MTFKIILNKKIIVVLVVCSMESFVDVVYAKKDDLFNAVRRAMFYRNEKMHNDAVSFTKYYYSVLLNTIKKDIPDHAINCSFSLNSEYLNGSFIYSLCFEIPKEQQYYSRYKGKTCHSYESFCEELWNDLEDLEGYW